MKNRSLQFAGLLFASLAIFFSSQKALALINKSPFFTTIAEPFLQISGTITPFVGVEGSVLAPKFFTVTTTTGNSVSVKAPNGFQVSGSSGSGFDSVYNYIAGSDYAAIWVRPRPSAVGTFADSVIVNSNVARKALPVRASIAPRPTISLIGWDSNTSFLNIQATTASTSFGISYAETANSPNNFTLKTTGAKLPGFTDIVNANLPSSPLTFPVANMPAGEYYFTLWVTNSSTGATSIPYQVKLIVTNAGAKPAIVLNFNATNGAPAVNGNDNTLSLPFTLASGSVNANTFTLTAGTRALPGFAPLVNGNIQNGNTIFAALPSGQPGIYDFNLKLRNSNTGDSSQVYPITLYKRGLQNVFIDTIINVTAGQESKVRPLFFTAKGLTTGSLTALLQTESNAPVVFTDQTGHQQYTVHTYSVSNNQIGPATLYVKALSSTVTGQFTTIISIFDGGPQNLVGNVVMRVRVAPVVPAPQISVSGAAQTYTTTVPVTPIIPTSNGGAVPTSGYGFTSTYSGTTTPGSTNGSVPSATFNNIWGMAINGQGTIFVGENYTSIRKISGGVVTGFTSRGSGEGMVFDKFGNMFVAANNFINKIDPGGGVSVFAGSGNNTSVDGTGTAASFSGASGMAIDAQDNLYVSEQVGRKIRKITPDGVVTTIAGSGATGSSDGPGTSASFRFPSGLAFDAVGNLYVADAGSNAIRKITPAGIVSTLAGSATAGHTDGQGAAASFTSPYGITYDANSGDLFVACTRNIRRISTSGLVTTVAGGTLAGFVNGQGASARFNSGYAIVNDGIGNLYVSEGAYIRKISVYGYGVSPALPAGLVLNSITGAVSGTPTTATPARNYTLTAANAGGVSHANINITVNQLPAPVVSYSPAVYSFANGMAITPFAPTNSGGAVPATGYGQTFTLSGTTTAGSANGSSASATYTAIWGLAFDANKVLYIGDNYVAVRRVSGGQVSNFTNTGAGEGMVFDAAGNMYVAADNLIKRITPAGVVTVFAGNSTRSSVDGTGTAATFNGASGIAIDAQGVLYVSEQVGRKIRKITPAGVVTTFAGSGVAGSANGTGTAASFKFPTGLVFDSSGNLYVADVSSQAIRKITPTGVVSTLAGSGVAGNADGWGATASFTSPYGLAYDAVTGDLFVACSRNIRRVSSAGFVSTIAGAATAGFVNGDGNAARFTNGYAIVYDGSGNLLVAEGTYIRRVSVYGYGVMPALPAGLAFNVGNGAISGTPTTPTPASNYVVTAANVGGLGRDTVNITVASPIINAFVDTSGVKTWDKTSWTFNVSINSGTADSYTVTSGTRIMPGFVAQNGTLQANGGAFSGVINVPIGILGTFDFNIRFKNSATGDSSQVYQFVGYSRGFENTYSLGPIEYIPGASNAQAIPYTFTIKGLTKKTLLISTNPVTPNVSTYLSTSASESGPGSSTLNLPVVNNQIGPITIYLKAVGSVAGTFPTTLSFYDGASPDKIADVEYTLKSTEPIVAQVDTIGIKNKEETNWKVNVYFSNGGADSYIVTPGVRAMPGFTKQSGSSDPNGNFTITLNVPGGTLGAYDFNIKLKNSTTGDSSQVYRFIGYSRGLENVSALTNITYNPGDPAPGPLVPFTFTAKGLNSNGLWVVPASNDNCKVLFYLSPTDSPLSFIKGLEVTNNQVGPITIYIRAQGNQSGEYPSSILMYDGVPVSANTVAEIPFTYKSIPPVASYHLTFSNTTANSATVSWTNGNGTARAVFVKQVSSGVATAKDSVTYTPGNFGAGTQIGTTGWYCVYDGTGSSATINGLSPSATYRVTVIDYNGRAGAQKYITSGLAPASFTTPADPAAAPTASAYKLAFTNTTANSTTINWTNGNGAARAVFIANANNGVAAPAINTIYAANTAFGAGTQVGTTGWYCIYNGAGSTINVTNLVGNQPYRVTVVEYNNPASPKYITSGLAPATVVTPPDPAAAPTTSAYRVAFTNTTANSTTVSWTNGNGSARAVFIANTNNGVAAPAANTTYNANNTFGVGTQVGSTGWYCIYNGTGSTVNVTNLLGNQNYRVTVVEYNGTTGNQKYATTGLAPSTVTTLPDPAAAPTQAAYGLAFTNITNTTATVSWTNGNGANRAVFVTQNNFGAAAPVANTTYAGSTNFGAGSQIGATGWYCVYVGNGNTVNLAGLTSGATYRVTVVDYNGAAGNQKYVTAGLAPANVTTTGIVAPSQASYRLTFSGTTQNSTTVSWTNGNGAARAVFVKQANNGLAQPVAGTTYTANSSFGAGTQIGSTGWYCVYVGAGNSAAITNLAANTVYRVTVVDYNGAGGSQQYIASGLSPAMVTTSGIATSGFRINSLITSADPAAMAEIEAANILSPNGDGKNDTWIVKNIELYPNNSVSVFTKDGKQIFHEKGYYNEWNGGGSLTKGTYYYTIDLGNGETKKGYITVL